MSEIKGVISLEDVPTFEDVIEALKRVQRYIRNNVPEGEPLREDFNIILDCAYRELRDQAQLLYNAKIRLNDFYYEVNARTWTDKKIERGGDSLKEYGEIVETQRVAQACRQEPQFIDELHEAFYNYIHNEWGETSEEDKAENDKAIIFEDRRIVAKYKTSKGNIFIITEADRSYTTIMFCDEY